MYTYSGMQVLSCIVHPVNVSICVDGPAFNKFPSITSPPPIPNIETTGADRRPNACSPGFYLYPLKRISGTSLVTLYNMREPTGKLRRPDTLSFWRKHAVSCRGSSSLNFENGGASIHVNASQCFNPWLSLRRRDANFHEARTRL